jgi:pimeloyl-ACP methyl ester carboxylesterase
MYKKMIVLFIFVIMGTCSLAYSQESQVPDYVKSAMTEIASENYPAFYSRFDEQMKAAMSEEKLQETWKSIITQAGSFKSQLSSVHQKSGEYDVYITTCQFERVALDVQLVFNQKQQISGLFFKPAASTNRPQEPKKPYPYHEEEVTYKSMEPGITLAGTLTVPKSGGPFPAVVLISGSDAQNRDEELMGHKPFLVLADYLTRRGIAVLRFDDRGVGGSSGDFSSATSENFAQDVMGGVSYLKSRKKINHTQIGLIGHSEGGVIAPMVASISSDIAFIVMMAGTGVNGEEILKLQAELLIRANGTSEELIKENTKVQEMMFDIIKTTTDKEAAKKKAREALSDIKPIIKDVALAQMDSAMTPWMRYFISYEPKTVLEKVKCPVLAINGEKDLQVSPQQNLPEIEKALKAAKNKDFKTIELPGLNHLFQTCKTGSVTEYAQIEETISPTVLELISSWILERVS